uniref:hypothetical protein n=1 Tax=Pectobacterium carotovorum TaxID=554 RepID=UPI001D159FD9|nr:hypothetical protein [Pectobacterium carotovorum]
MGPIPVGIPTALWSAQIPIALLTQFKFPNYLSVLRSLTFLFLLVLAERFDIADVAPLSPLPASTNRLLRERQTFDQQVNTLLTCNGTRNDNLLTKYRQWAEPYLQRRIDKNADASLIRDITPPEMPQRNRALFLGGRALFPDDTVLYPPPHGEDK